MLLDNSLNLDIALAVTTTGSSTNYIDTIGAAGGQAQISGINTIQGGYDAYEQLWWEVLVTTTVTGTASTTIDFQLWTANVIANIWTTGNAGSVPTAVAGQTVKLLSTGATNATSLISSAGGAGKAYQYKAKIPQGAQRFLSSFYVMGGGAVTGGAWSSVLLPDVDINLT